MLIMKSYSVFGLATALFLLSCGNAADESASTATDSATNEASNAALAPGDTAQSASVATATSATFKESMDKMMQDMHSMPMSGDPDHDFATMMKHHHQGAIDMSQIELAKGANAELKQLAQKIIADSQKDIQELNSFLGSHQPSQKSDFGKKQMDKMLKSMNMNMEHGGDTDKEFAMMMAMHHQHGIDMARDYLKVGTAEETKNVANNTIKANSEDLKKLKAHTGNADHSGHDMSQKGQKKEGDKGAGKEQPATDHSQHQ
jgi:uncharacterized protein (DUF305 family)